MEFRAGLTTSATAAVGVGLMELRPAAEDEVKAMRRVPRNNVPVVSKWPFPGIVWGHHRGQYDVLLDRFPFVLQTPDERVFSNFGLFWTSSMNDGHPASR